MDATEAPATIALVCADWCSTCRDYRSTFETAIAAHPHDRFVWIDLEDDAALFAGLDLDTFPSLLVAQGGRALYYGSLPPDAEALDALLAAGCAKPGVSSASAPVIDALIAHLAEA